MPALKTSFSYTTLDETDRRVAAVIVCGGSSSRMNGVNKIFAPICGVPVAARTVSAFEKCGAVDSIIIVVKQDDLLRMQQLCESSGFKKVTDIVPGGSCRQASVACGMERVADDTSVVLVHDGARPFVSKACIERVVDAAYKYSAAAPAVRLKDTVKYVRQDGLVLSTPDRNSLAAVQTPQGFRADLYKEALRRFEGELESFTDDCSIMERMGNAVYIVDGEYENIKITTAEDLLYAEFLLGGASHD